MPLPHPTLHQLVNIFWTRIIENDPRIVQKRSTVANRAEPVLYANVFVHSASSEVFATIVVRETLKNNVFRKNTATEKTVIE